MVRSKDSGLPIFAGPVDVGEVDSKCFLKVTQSNRSTPQDLVICVEEVEVPLWRGLQVQITPRDDPDRKMWTLLDQVLSICSSGESACLCHLVHRTAL